MKKNQRALAVELRKSGLSYTAIQDQVAVSKSTLSQWLRVVEITEAQRASLRRKGGLVAAETRRERRRALQRALYEAASKEIDSVSRREAWLMGIVLYWAEGAKEKEYRPGTGIEFTNSDPVLVRLFLRWLIQFPGMDSRRIVFAIFLHESHRDSVDQIRSYWAKETGFTPQNFQRVYFKSNTPTNRRNIGRNYHGVLRVKVKASSKELRWITGWMKGIDRSLGGGVTGNTPAFGAGNSGSSPGPPAAPPGPGSSGIEKWPESRRA